MIWLYYIYSRELYINERSPVGGAKCEGVGGGLHPEMIQSEFLARPVTRTPRVNDSGGPEEE
jgi:hypothetical protein